MYVSYGIRFGIGHQLGRALVPLFVVLVLMLSSWAIVEVVAWAEQRRRASRASGLRLDNAPRPLPENTPDFFADLWASIRVDPRVLSISHDYTGGPIVITVRQNPGAMQTVPEVVRAAATRHPIEIRWHPDVFDPSEFDALTAEGDRPMLDHHRCPHCGTYAPWTEPDVSRCRECGRPLDGPPAEAEAPSCPEGPHCTFPRCRPEFHPGECGRFGVGATVPPASSAEARTPEARTIADRLAEIRENAPDVGSPSDRLAAYEALAREPDRTRTPDVEPGALIRAVEAMTPEDRSRLRAALDPEAEAIRPVLVRAAALVADRLGPLVRRFREATGGPQTD